jgi:hypothetical protein
MNNGSQLPTVPIAIEWENAINVDNGWTAIMTGTPGSDSIRSSGQTFVPSALAKVGSRRYSALKARESEEALQ